MTKVHPILTMKHSELRQLFDKHFITGDIKKYDKYSVINESFPGNFNLSFSEPEMAKQFGSLISIKHLLHYSKIQPCIRIEDFIHYLIPLTNNSNMYLGLFDMAGVCLCDPTTMGAEDKTKRLIEQAWKFLTSELNLDPRKIIVKCFAGGDIKNVTKSKYEINKEVEPDNLSIALWKQLGVLEKNIQKDQTRDTFLALHIYKPTPWGYRTEILYKTTGRLLDIGTIEHFLWKPIFGKGRITDIKQWENSCSITVFGLERINLLVNNLKHVRECDHIKPIYTEIYNDAKIKDEKLAYLLTESIRTSQRILTDSGGYFKLSRHRKKKLTIYIQQIYKLLKKLDIPVEKLKEYLKINATAQPWYPELLDDIDLVNKELIDAFSRRF